AALPLAERVPVHGVPEGPRDFDWRATDPATLVWAEALDKGDWNVNVPQRDRLMLQSAPFTAAPREIARTTQRYAGFDWTARPQPAPFPPAPRGTARTPQRYACFDWPARPQRSFPNESAETRHWRQTRIVDIDDPKQEARLLWDLSSDELYGDPGSFVYQRLPNGAVVVREEDGKVFLRGQGSSPQGDRPFLDRLDLATLSSERLFRSATDAYDQFLGFTAEPGRYLTWHQSVIDPPNAWLRELGARDAAAREGEAQYAAEGRALTHV